MNMSYFDHDQKDFGFQESHAQKGAIKGLFRNSSQFIMLLVDILKFDWVDLCQAGSSVVEHAIKICQS